MSKTFVITGGAGFIGSNFIYYMLNEHPDDTIVCIDSLTYAGNLATLSNAMANPNFKFIRADITNRSAIDAIFKEVKPDVVVNFAAESHVDRSILNPQLFLETNIIGTSILMDSALKNDVSRFHQVSTDEVYGDLPLDKPEMLFTEDTPLHTSSPYSSSKAAADLLVMAYSRTYGLPVTISRCSNNYGPYQFPEKLIPLMINRALTNQKMPIYGDGLNIRDWLYVEDHCSAIDLILKRGAPGEVYNVGGNNEKSNIEIVNLILSTLGKSRELIEYVPDRKGHDRRYAINSSKIRKKLGWSPKTMFDEGILKTINWCVENDDWYRSILNQDYLKFNNRVDFFKTN